MRRRYRAATTAGLDRPRSSSSAMVRCASRDAGEASPRSAEENPLEPRHKAGRTSPTIRAMGAVDTMEDFFEKLNDGDRAAAVALMDERVEMRVHVGDNARTLRGVEQVGGWFLRAEPGLKMIPGQVRERQAELLGDARHGVARPDDVDLRRRRGHGCRGEARPDRWPDRRGRAGHRGWAPEAEQAGQREEDGRCEGQRDDGNEQRRKG